MYVSDKYPEGQTRLIPRAEVLQILGISSSTLWRMIRRGDFPKPVHISARRVGFPSAEVASEIQRMVADRDLGMG